MVKILFDFHECLKKRLLRKTQPSKTLLSAYLAVFHAARSILFLDGYREKSHACIARYLEEKYVRKGLLESEWVEMLDHFRELRHTDQYSFNFFASADESKDTVAQSKEFVSRMEKLVYEVSRK